MIDSAALRIQYDNMIKTYLRYCTLGSMLVPRALHLIFIECQFLHDGRAWMHELSSSPLLVHYAIVNGQASYLPVR
jgi:hypothetical protein